MALPVTEVRPSSRRRLIEPHQLPRRLRAGMVVEVAGLGPAGVAGAIPRVAAVMGVAAANATFIRIVG